jgi:hypothetical protein
VSNHREGSAHTRSHLPPQPNPHSAGRGNLRVPSPRGFVPWRLSDAGRR